MLTDQPAGSRPWIPRKQSDLLLKAVFEEYFAEFLRFMYPEADEIFDFSKAFVFLDKDLRRITPLRKQNKGKRSVDLLVQTYLKSGDEKWILVHVEIEGGNQEGFAFRAFQYHYRILDRFSRPVETIVFYTGPQNQRTPTSWQSRTIKTVIRFDYLSYPIFQHTEAELLSMENPFALVVLACQKALLEKKIPEEELGQDRLTIAKALLRYEYPKDRIANFLAFLKNFLFIENQEINRKFDTIAEQITGGETTMGIIEAIKKIEREEGKAEGKVEGIAEGIEKGKYDQSVAIARELKKEGLSVEFISRTTGLAYEVIKGL